MKTSIINKNVHKPNGNTNVREKESKFQTHYRSCPSPFVKKLWLGLCGTPLTSLGQKCGPKLHKDFIHLGVHHSAYLMY